MKSITEVLSSNSILLIQAPHCDLLPHKKTAPLKIKNNDNGMSRWQLLQLITVFLYNCGVGMFLFDQSYIIE